MAPPGGLFPAESTRPLIPEGGTEAACPTPARTYSRRDPEKTVLYQIVAENLETFLQDARDRSEHGFGYPRFIERTFRRYLDCGYHGVFAKSTPHRKHVPPPPRPDQEEEQQPTAAPGTDEKEPEQKTDTKEQETEKKPTSKAAKIRWAELIRRVFKIDVEQCPHCGGKRVQIALLTDPPVVRKILNHLDLPTEPPPIAPARAPPQQDLDFEDDLDFEEE